MDAGDTVVLNALPEYVITVVGKCTTFVGEGGWSSGAGEELEKAPDVLVLVDGMVRMIGARDMLKNPLPRWVALPS